MGILKGSLISVNKDETIAIEELNKRDNVLSVQKTDGL